MLACPVCGGDLEPDVQVRCFGCGAGHRFDRARQGHVTLLGGRGRHGLVADDAAMVAARFEVQSSGLYRPILDGVVQAVLEGGVLPAGGVELGGVLDCGGGTGYYAAGVLSQTPLGFGVGMDLSVYAARRAAKAHAGLVSVVADTWERFPIRDGSVQVALVVFAPRHGAELGRVLRPDGVVVVVTPLSHHLAELSGAMRVRVDPRKEERLAASMEGFEVVSQRCVESRVPVEAAQGRLLVGMGPGAHHAGDVDGLVLPSEVTLAVRVGVYRPVGVG
ncbi:methyltransferase domain-containing protein [Dermatophilus congolensis]|nr:methyltransferase domain-containing protein [Dermatophilus congolensis]MBO3151757.1 methyltransferase domain-containing protein [Dermatophilus congolensis]MBO3161241.1 methyltransferase domain-containing protein [Dermatophilus congolensis]MBO3163039.1 methyltransferase domain-containing protein [Dermatophilus congolensis]MBO3176591.1 methyltransferase domain-containing protein [Dermatophilus congolensis]